MTDNRLPPRTPEELLERLTHARSMEENIAAILAYKAVVSGQTAVQMREQFERREIPSWRDHIANPQGIWPPPYATPEGVKGREIFYRKNYDDEFRDANPDLDVSCEFEGEISAIAHALTRLSPYANEDNHSGLLQDYVHPNAASGEVFLNIDFEKLGRDLTREFAIELISSGIFYDLGHDRLGYMWGPIPMPGIRGHRFQPN